MRRCSQSSQGCPTAHSVAHSKGLLYLHTSIDMAYSRCRRLLIQTHLPNMKDRTCVADLPIQSLVGGCASPLKRYSNYCRPKDYPVQNLHTHVLVRSNNCKRSAELL